MSSIIYISGQFQFPYVDRYQSVFPEIKSEFRKLLAESLSVCHYTWPIHPTHPTDGMDNWLYCIV